MNPSFGDSFDGKVRFAIYQSFLEQNCAPTTPELAQRLSCTTEEVQAALRRLDASHVITLLRDSDAILRAPPFWTAPTSFHVEAGEQFWWGSCIWDALGIPAMLQRNARIVTSCGCCGAEMTLEVSGGSLREAEGMIHFAVPASRWYEDVVFT
jgi:alkylmercury lyase